MQLSDSDIVLLKIDVEDAEGGNVGDDDDDKIGVDTFDPLPETNLSTSHLVIKFLNVF